jgi:hypothetical protein
MAMVCAGVDCHAEAEWGSIEPIATAQAAEWISLPKSVEGYHGSRALDMQKIYESQLTLDNLRYIVRYIEMEKGNYV